MKAILAVALLLTVIPAPAVARQVRDTPPPLIENARRERDLRATIAAGTATRDTYLELAALLNRQNRFDDVLAAMRGVIALDPSSPEPQHQIAVFIWDRVRSDTTLDTAKKRSYLQQGVDAENRALTLRPDYLEAMTYKNILLRLEANASSDPVEQKRLIDEADTLRNRVLELQRDRQAQPQAGPVAPAPPFAGFSEPFEQAVARLQPVRIGGDIRMPTKIKDAKPVYPPIAQSARVQGVVIIEAVVDENGTVVNARVLRSIPLLDAAALGAVSQWQFMPTDVNGRPVAVLTTVTVNFVMQ